MASQVDHFLSGEWITFRAARPGESGLLRQVLLDEFVRRRPRTKDDWFRFIPYDLRSQTDSRQVGQYLSRVLDMITSSYQ